MANYSSFKQIQPIEILFLILFILYIVVPTEVPYEFASFIDSPLGMILLFLIVLFLFLYTNPVLGVLFIFVAYELIRRSSLVSAKTALTMFTPSEVNRAIEMEQMNPTKHVTLEEEIIRERAPFEKGSATDVASSPFKPVADKISVGASLV
jgi:energy-coupling factor transporter transmembrane protein EcfT